MNNANNVYEKFKLPKVKKATVINNKHIKNFNIFCEKSNTKIDWLLLISENYRYNLNTK